MIKTVWDAQLAAGLNPGQPPFWDGLASKIDQDQENIPSLLPEIGNLVCKGIASHRPLLLYLASLVHIHLKDVALTHSGSFGSTASLEAQLDFRLHLLRSLNLPTDSSADNVASLLSLIRSATIGVSPEASDIYDRMIDTVLLLKRIRDHFTDMNPTLGLWAVLGLSATSPTEVIVTRWKGVSRLIFELPGKDYSAALGMLTSSYEQWDINRMESEARLRAAEQEEAEKRKEADRDRAERAAKMRAAINFVLHQRDSQEAHPAKFSKVNGSVNPFYTLGFDPSDVPRAGMVKFLNAARKRLAVLLHPDKLPIDDIEEKKRASQAFAIMQNALKTATQLAKSKFNMKISGAFAHSLQVAPWSSELPWPDNDDTGRKRRCP